MGTQSLISYLPALRLHLFLGRFWYSKSVVCESSVRPRWPSTVILFSNPLSILFSCFFHFSLLAWHFSLRLVWMLQWQILSFGIVFISYGWISLELRLSTLCFPPCLRLFTWPPRIWFIDKSVGQEGCQSVSIFAVANLVRFNNRAIAKNSLLYWSSKPHLPMKNDLPKRFSGLLIHACKTQKLYNASVGEGIQVSNRKLKVLSVTRNQLTNFSAFLNNLFLTLPGVSKCFEVGVWSWQRNVCDKLRAARNLILRTLAKSNRRNAIRRHTWRIQHSRVCYAL